MRLFPNTRAGWTRLTLLVITPVLSVALLLSITTSMPGASFVGVPPALSVEGVESAARIRVVVEQLAVAIGERNQAHPPSLEEAAALIERSLVEFGYEVRRQPSEVGPSGTPNLEALKPGSQPGSACLVIGAHYDSVRGSPGADDNASGVAAVLELARILRDRPFRHDIRFVFFANEEPPYFQTELMGSLVYARALAVERTPVFAMLSLESIGYFADEPGSQRYPFPLGLLYPDRGNFVGFVGDVGSRDLVRRTVGAFREEASVPSEGLAAPAILPGVAWSDHWSFWQIGVPAVMITCTAPFRNPHYHERTDTAERLDFDAMARVVEGLVAVVERLDQDER